MNQEELEVSSKADSRSTILEARGTSNMVKAMSNAMVCFLLIFLLSGRLSAQSGSGQSGIIVSMIKSGKSIPDPSSLLNNAELLANEE